MALRRRHAQAPWWSTAGSLAAVIAVALTTGCASDAVSQVDAATDTAITTSLRGLPAVTGATATESAAPVDTLVLSMTTALDKSSPDDLTAATELLSEAAHMAYAVRHETVDAVAVSVYGVDSAAAESTPDALLAQNTFPTSELAAGSP